MAKILIESLHLKDIRHFSEVNIHFNNKFNFIAGPNGCGKTSILACLSHCFRHTNLEYSRFKSSSELWVNIKNNETKYRLGVGKDSFQSNGYRHNSIVRWNLPPVISGRTSLPIHEVKQKIKGVPLFIGAQRSIKYQQLQGTRREAQHDQKLDEYLNNNVKSLYGDWTTNIKQWFINRYFMIEKDWAHEEKINWEFMIKGIEKLAPFNSNFKYLRTERDLEPIFSIYGKECYLEELSAGFQAILIIIANIIEWIEGSNEPGFRNINNAVGSVAIDELDVHLHPEWQFTIRDTLTKIFPNIQFIVTTHSPHLLASAKENEIIILPKYYEDKKYDIKPIEKRISGWNTDQILSDIMGVVSLDNKDYSQMITSAYKFIETKDIPNLKSTIEKIESICNPNDSISVVLKSRLAELEIEYID